MESKVKSNEKYRILSLGTNNWQSKDEPAPGSGILHKTHHDVFNKIPRIEAYSMFPTTVQDNDPNSMDYRVIKLNHKIPIYEGASPVSDFRIHSKEFDFGSYYNFLLNNVREYVGDIETNRGGLDLLLANHSVFNPAVLSEINDERIAGGKERIPLATFVHGTGLKMYENEINGLKDFPKRYYPWIKETGVFDSSTGKVDIVFTISNEEKEKFQKLFKNYDPKNVVVSGNGFNTQYFYPFDERPSLSNALEGIINAVDGKPFQNLEEFDKKIVFTGKFDSWKRLDALLLAANTYEESLKKEKGWDVATIIVGKGPEFANKFYHRLAEDFGVKNALFTGYQGQDISGKINNAADLGVYPSRGEPFGLVILEGMASGLPVLAANSGGPKDFVDERFGYLLPETENRIEFAQNLSGVVEKALLEDWKTTKGPAAAKHARENFGPERQVKQILDEVKKRVK